MRALICFLFTGVIIKVLFWLLESSSSNKGSTQDRPQKEYVSRFTYFNPNPDATIDETTGKPARWNKCDCVVRAFCGVLGLPWDTVYSGLCAIGKEMHDMPDSSKVIIRYAK